jgi:hypothetical protein
LSRNTLVATALLTAARLMPRCTPLIGSLVRMPITTVATGAMLIYTVIDLMRDGTGSDASRRSRRQEQEPPYDEWTHAELYERARQLDIPGRSRMAKNELIAELTEWERA